MNNELQDGQVDLLALLAPAGLLDPRSPLNFSLGDSIFDTLDSDLLPSAAKKGKKREEEEEDQQHRQW